MYQALAAATINAAHSIGRGASHGSLQVTFDIRLPFQNGQWSLLDPGILGIRSMGLDVCMSIGDLVETDVTLTDEDTNSIKTDNANIIGNPRQCNVAMQPGGQIWNQCKWRQ